MVLVFVLQVTFWVAEWLLWPAANALLATNASKHTLSVPPTAQIRRLTVTSV
jgi:hypothetical protein